MQQQFDEGEMEFHSFKWPKDQHLMQYFTYQTSDRGHPDQQSADIL
jgi:hypothetical protein